MPTDEKRQMIDSTDKTFTIEEQCKLVDLLRSTFYYSEVGASKEDLAIMRKMDEMLYQFVRSNRVIPLSILTMNFAIPKEKTPKNVA